MPIEGQVIKSERSKPQSLELVHQSLVTKVSRVVHNRPRKQKYLASVFLGNFLQERSPLRQGEIVDAFDGGDHVIILK